MNGVITKLGILLTIFAFAFAVNLTPVMVDSAYAGPKVCKPLKKIFNQKKKTAKKSAGLLNKLDKRLTSQNNRLGKSTQKRSDTAAKLASSQLTKNAKFNTQIDKVNNKIQWGTTQRVAQEAIVLIECIFGGGKACSKALKLVQKFITFITKQNEKKDNIQDKQSNFNSAHDQKEIVSDAKLAEKQARDQTNVNTALSNRDAQVPIAAQKEAERAQAEADYLACLAANP